MLALEEKTYLFENVISYAALYVFCGKNTRQGVLLSLVNVGLVWYTIYKLTTFLSIKPYP